MATKIKKNKVIGIVKKAATVAKKGSARIAILNFNSPTSAAKGLKVATKFKQSDLELPLETTRVAKSNGKLVLVIDAGHGVANKVFCAESKYGSLELAATEFGKANKIGSGRIGIIDTKNGLVSESLTRYEDNLKKNIFDWAKRNKFDGVIFSALGRRFNDALGINFSVNAAGNYIAGLTGKKQKIVIDSLKAIDKSIKTPFLDNFRASLGGKSKTKSVAKMVKAN